MSYTKKLFGITKFGIENNYVLIGIILLISCLLMPALTILSIMDNRRYLDDTNAQVIVRIYGAILAYFEGFALPLGLFSYVHKRRQCDFYSSMPVRRSQYFWGYVLTGIIVFLMSFGWMCLAHFVITGFRNILPCLLQPVAVFLVIYCSMILAVCFSGSVMSTIVTFTVRNAVVISVILLPIIISGANMNSYIELLGKKICVLTPVTAIGAWIEEWYDVMLLQLPVAAVELTAAFFLHSHRKSETTAAIAFPRSRYPFQYIVMLMTALLTDALLSYLMPYNYGSVLDEDMIMGFARNDFYMFIFLTAIIILVAFIILNIILERSGKAAFSKIRHFFIFSACYGLILFTLFNYIAPNIPHSILPFKPDCAIICVREYTITKEKNDYDREYEDEDEEISHREEERYSVNESAYVKEAYCVTDRKLLKELVDLVQSRKEPEDDLFSCSLSPYDYPYVNSKENLDSVKKYDVYFLKGNIPYIQEGMSIFNFDDFDYIYGGKRTLRYCYTLKNNPVMDRFKEIRLDTKGLQLNTSSFSVVFSPDGGQMPETTQIRDPEIYPPYGDITWEGSETTPETSNFTWENETTPETSNITWENETPPETSAIAIGAAQITYETEPPLNLIG